MQKQGCHAATMLVSVQGSVDAQHGTIHVQEDKHKIPSAGKRFSRAHVLFNGLVIYNSSSGSIVKYSESILTWQLCENAATGATKPFILERPVKRKGLCGAGWLLLRHLSSASLKPVETAAPVLDGTACQRFGRVGWQRRRRPGRYSRNFNNFSLRKKLPPRTLIKQCLSKQYFE